MEGAHPRIRKNWKQKQNSIAVAINRRCPKPSRLYVTDKKTNVQFLVAPDAQVSLFPKCLASENSEKIEPSQVLVNNSGTIILTFGQITHEIDIGLGKLFSWKFTLVGFERPIIGRDFLSHFRLKLNFEKLCFENPETGLQTTKVSTVSCECHRTENSNDGWPLVTAIFERNIKHRNHVTDKISKIPFLIGSDSEISIFPKSKLRRETLEPFDGSFELHGICDNIVQVLGWTIRKLNFGTGREFTWKFAVIEYDMPIIGLDFLRELRLVQQLKMGYFSLFDSQTKISTLPPAFPCGCGTRFSGWPTSTFLVVAPISKSGIQRKANSDPQGNSRSVQSKPGTSRQNPEPTVQNPRTFNPNSRNRKDCRGFYRNSRRFRRYGSRRPTTPDEERGFESRKPKEEIDKKNPGTDHKAAEKKNSSKKRKSVVKHRFHVDDKNSKLPFLIGSAAEVSVFPICKVKEEDLEPFDGSFELKGAFGEILPVLGWTTRILDIGLTRKFTWKFAVTDISKPILGADFLSHYGFSIGAQSLIDKETCLTTPPPSGPCECGKVPDGWPSLSLLTKRPIIARYKSETRKEVRKSETESVGSRNIKHRLHVDDKNSKLPFLIGSAAEVSVFPICKVKEEELEPFDGSFELKGAFGEVLPVLGWTTRILDIGLTRNFTWKFAVTDISKPILGADFISHYGFSIGAQSLIDKETCLTAPPPSGPCDCGKVPDGWPSLSLLTKKPITARYKSETLKKEVGKSETESRGSKNIKHRLHVDDQNSKLPFLIGSGAAISVFPKSKVQEEDLEPFDGSFELDCGYRDPIQILGWMTRTLDIGLARNFTWKFAVIDIGMPIIGVDFITHYRLVIKGQSLIDKETCSVTSPPSGPCECGKVPDGWPSMSLLTKRPITARYKSETRKEEVRKSETKSGGSRNIKHRLHVDDQNSKLTFLIISTAEISVFPKSKVQEEDLEPFDGSFELVVGYGEPVQILGWITRTLDIGLARNFTWKFAVIDIGMPIIGMDVITHYRLVIRGESLIDRETNLTTPPPSGPCDCGKFTETSFILTKIPVSRPVEFEASTEQCGLSEIKSEIPQEEIKPKEEVPNRFDVDDKNSKLPFLIGSAVTVSVFTNLEVKEGDLKPFGSSETETEEEFDTSKVSEKPKEDSEQLDQVVEGEAKYHVNHRFHVNDKNSKLPFLIGSAAEVSVFPIYKVKQEELEPFDGSFELKGAFGEVVPVLGWTTRTLDIGLTRNFTWKFAVTDTSKPILGVDFISHYGFSISGKNLIDPTTNLTIPPLPGPCDCGKFDDGWPSMSDLTKVPFFGGAKFKTQEDETETSEAETNTSEGSKTLEEDSKQTDEEETKHEINRHFHLLDKNSEILFFVSGMAQVSVFPRSKLEGRLNQVPEGSEIIDCVSLVFPVYGYATLKLDFGLEREFEWKFAVVESSRPIIGLDFLKNFDLKVDYKMGYPRLFDQKTNLRTAEFTGSCNCVDFYDFALSTVLRKSYSECEGFSVQEKCEITNTRCADDHCPQEKRMILVERETQMPYLLSGAELSVFPKSKAKEEEIEPFDDAFDLINVFGSVVPIYGWIIRKLDFGLGRYFVWKLAVINISRPMISTDFLIHYDFTVDFKNRSVFDYVTSNTAIGSTEFCECQARCYWPDISTMEKRVKKERRNVSTDSTEMK